MEVDRPYRRRRPAASAAGAVSRRWPLTLAVAATLAGAACDTPPPPPADHGLAVPDTVLPEDTVSRPALPPPLEDAAARPD